MYHFFTILFLLICGHFVADYVLQPEFIANGKNPYKPIPNIPWVWVMLAHCFTHALAVYLITQSLYLSLFELLIHFWIDWLKCRSVKNCPEKQVSFFDYDQLFHIICKIYIAVVFFKLI